MTTLAANTPRTFEIGDRNEFPVIASDIIYEGAAVGIVAASGHARPLTSVDKFVGFAESKADNSDGSAGDINVRVKKKGVVKLAISGAVITDIDKAVYATDDNAFQFSPVGGVFIGFTRRFVASGYMMVEYNAGVLKDPNEGFVAEAVSADKTLDAEDSGKLLWIDTDAKAITLPAVNGMSKIRVMNGGAYGTIAVTVSPNASDMIEGADITGADDGDRANTKATACRGDYIDLDYGDANGWVITAKVGTWT